ncbi:glycoside hydrolase family 113 [Ligilactobacillus cholophilus]|uniref:glycoside hydrolase family 113 n=1 Tax=Ligilactobacillus cholophilus TaxID=3050131 RepID=UPI0025B22791|nr:hypothetical protein [Ligilactobacillus cholophilus]
MKNLTLLNDNTNIKLNDTGTVIQFKASNEGQPVGLSNGQNAVFRIKNELGFLKSVQATTSYGGYVFELDTSNLSDLVPDTYQVELLVQVDSDNALIFPDNGFIDFTITKNALNIIGEQLPVMSLDDFTKQFDNYVQSVKQGPQGPQGVQGPKGDKGDKGNAGAITTVKSVKSLLDLFSKYYQIDASRASVGTGDYNYYDKNNLTLYNYQYNGETVAYYPYNSGSGSSATLSPIPLDKGCQNSGIQIDFDLVTTADGGTFTVVLPDFPSVILPVNEIKQGTNHYSFFAQTGSVPSSAYFVNMGLKLSNYTGQLGIKNLVVRVNNAFVDYEKTYDAMIKNINSSINGKADTDELDLFDSGLFDSIKPYLTEKDNLSNSIEQALHETITNTNDLINATNNNLSKFASSSMVMSPTNVKGGNVSAFGDMDYNEIQNQGEALNLNTITVSLLVRCDSATSSTLTVTDDDWAKVKADVAALKQRGFKILIQPYPYIANGSVAEVDWNPSDITTWFNQYSEILQQIAEYAQSEKLYGMYVATNLVHLEQYEDKWVSIIQNVKKTYSGKVFFRTNWWKTASWAPETVTAYQATLNRTFWQYVDVIAIAAYFEVTDEQNPGSETLQKELHATEIYDRKQDIVTEIKNFHDKWNKPVFFGELGLPPYSNAPSKPYDNQMDKTSKYSEVVQSNWFDAWYTVFSQFDWWLGYSIFEIGSNSSYNPYGKMASSTIRMQVFGGENKPTSMISKDVPNVPTKGDIWFVSDDSNNITAIKSWNGTEWVQFNLKLN